MATLRDIQWLRIGTESLAIVGSILLAFAIDAWWDEHTREDRESVLLSGLLEDLREDLVDYDGFVTSSQGRILAADLLFALADDPLGTPVALNDAEAFEIAAGNAFLRLGRPSQLETVLVTYDQMTSMGAATVIADPQLWRSIANYYALARDRSDTNAITNLLTTEYRNRLAELGWSPLEGDEIPVKEVLADRRLRAEILNIRDRAESSVIYGEEMITVAQKLIEEINSRLQ